MYMSTPKSKEHPSMRKHRQDQKNAMVEIKKFRREAIEWFNNLTTSEMKIIVENRSKFGNNNFYEDPTIRTT